MDAQPTPSRLIASVRGRTRGVRQSPLLSSAVLWEEWASHTGGHHVSAANRPHLDAALAWIACAQDATPDDGIARGYAIVWNAHFRSAGWQPSYPETTGYLIPTLLAAARLLGDAGWRTRALRAADWEIAVQLPSGAVQGGVVGEGRTPAVFNTGQVILGWLAAAEETGESRFADAARAAGAYLVSVLDADGHWRRGNSRFARADATLYNARTAWALAEAGVRLGEPAFRDAAERNLLAVVERQHPNGWFPNCCLHSPEEPLLHTLAYTIRGLVEGGRVLGNPTISRAGVAAARMLLNAVREDGWMSGRYAASWAPTVGWACLTGSCQMANIWLRLAESTGDMSWIAPARRALRYVKATQNRTSSDPGIRGGIRGSEPVGGAYGRHEVLNWATKFFADALMRDDAARTGEALDPIHALA